MKHSLLLAAAIAVAGCVPTPDTSSINPSNTTYVVTVGMENSNWAGACPGAGVDCTRMTELFKKYTTNVVSFQSEKANKKDIVKAMTAAAEKAELFIFFYSGHGGSDITKVNAPEEVDGKDEYLCFNDTYMLDDEIWAIISKCKGRVVLMFDCCHSQTLFRCPAFNLKRCAMKRLGATHTAEGSIKMLCWSGCPDDTYSYGDTAGGMFTNSMLKHFDPNLSYAELWSKIESDKSLASYEKVQQTTMSGFDTNVKVFK